MNQRILKQAQELQAKLAKIQDELANTHIEATSGGGAVKVTINGQQEIQSVKISPEVVNPQDVEMLEDLVLAAIKDAYTKSQELASKKMGGLTGGLKIPGLM
jgi:DNA-binding YbaB/EbfC family protein